MNACVFADCNSVMQQMAAVEARSGEHCKLPQRGLWRSSADIKFVAIYLENTTFGGHNFDDLPDNQLTKTTRNK